MTEDTDPRTNGGVLPDATLETLRDGMGIILFNRELEKVIANITDPNTSAEAKRKVVLTVTVAPNIDRDGATVLIEAICKLAPPKGETTTLHIGKRNGKPVAVTYDPRQPDMFGGNDPDVLPIHRDEEQRETGS